MSFQTVFRNLALLLAGVGMTCCQDISRDGNDYQAIFDQCDRFETGVNRASPDVLCLRGMIETETASAYFDIIDDRVRYVVVDGPGGYVDPAIRIADDITERGLTTIAGDICASSCSQFLFLGGGEKILLPSGGLFFHGGPIPEDDIEAMELSDKAKRNLARETRLFRAFYRVRGFDMDMLTKPPAHIQAQLDAGQIVFWSWPVDDLAGFGVDVTTHPSEDDEAG